MQQNFLELHFGIKNLHLEVLIGQQAIHKVLNSVI